MLNKNNERELAYVVLIDNITPIEGYDRVELAHVGGWTIVVGKDEFKLNDLAIYFEIDSKLPEVKPFTDMEFLAKKKFKITTQKMCHSLSQGLLMSAKNFGWTIEYDTQDNSGDVPYILDNNNEAHYVGGESRFLTKQLNVTYAVAADNSRKASSADKYKAMSQRHPKIFSKKIVRWFMRREWGRKLLFFFFGKKKDNKNAWPTHIASKTDVERVQNMIYILKDKSPYIATEKVDGSSFTAAAERTKFGKIKYYVCSRNVSFANENQTSYYDTNIWYEAYNKYNLKNILTNILNDYNLKNVAIQAEVYGGKIQQRDYSTNEHKMAVFHIVTNNTKFPINKVVEICNKYGLPHVPIIDWNYTLPDTIEEMQTFVESTPSVIDGKMKEGIVFYDKETGQTYFKFVSPEYLMKFH